MARERMQPYIKPNGTIGAKPTVYDQDGQLVPDPSWVEYLKSLRYADDELVIENLPMLLNLGDWGAQEAVIGHAKAFRDPKLGTTRIEITLSRENSQILDHLQEIAELKAIGFAGIMRKPKRWPSDPA